MPLLGSLLVTLFGGMLSFFVKFLAVRGAAVAAALATFAISIGAFYAAIQAAYATIATAFPAMVMTGVWLFIPDNAGVCLVAIVATDTAAALYRWNLETIHIATRTA